MLPDPKNMTTEQKQRFALFLIIAIAVGSASLSALITLFICSMVTP